MQNCCLLLQLLSRVLRRVSRCFVTSEEPTIAEWKRTPIPSAFISHQLLNALLATCVSSIHACSTRRLWSHEASKSPDYSQGHHNKRLYNCHDAAETRPCILALAPASLQGIYQPHICQSSPSPVPVSCVLKKSGFPGILSYSGLTGRCGEPQGTLGSTAEPVRQRVAAGMEWVASSGAGRREAPGSSFRTATTLTPADPPTTSCLPTATQARYRCGLTLYSLVPVWP